MNLNRVPTFSIDRDANICCTPRRNLDVERALIFLKALHSWGMYILFVCCVTNKYSAKLIHGYLTLNVFPQQANHGLDLNAVNDNDVFVPVLPLFEESSSLASSSSTSTSTLPSSSVLPPVFMNSFQAEQTRSLDAKLKELGKVFPLNDTLITLTEAKLLVTLLHINHICEAYSSGVDYIEDMLTNQLVKAIGKVVTPTDFSNYLSFHNRKIYRAGYQPQLFSYAIRRPDHDPEVHPFIFLLQ